ncbi:MAG: cellulose-binding protein [Porticoccaceae bacterium]|nr:cellulose-binding protein [Porticoccaceae bacterium]
MNNQLVISILTDDRPGVVEQVAAIITNHQGNWLESALSRLGGKFAGIILVDIPVDQQGALEAALAGLASKGIRVSVDHAGSATAIGGEQADFDVIGNDRQGIVGEISHVLARHNVSVDELYTNTENAPMSGELLFKASARVIIPKGMSREDLQEILEQLSSDLVVEFKEA